MKKRDSSFKGFPLCSSSSFEKVGAGETLVMFVLIDSSTQEAFPLSSGSFVSVTKYLQRIAKSADWGIGVVLGHAGFVWNLDS